MLSRHSRRVRSKSWRATGSEVHCVNGPTAGFPVLCTCVACYFPCCWLPRSHLAIAWHKPSRNQAICLAFSLRPLRFFASFCLCGEQDVCALRGPAFLRVLCVSVANRRMPIFTDSQKLNFSANCPLLPPLAEETLPKLKESVTVAAGPLKMCLLKALNISKRNSKFICSLM